MFEHLAGSRLSRPYSSRNSDFHIKKNPGYTGIYIGW